MGGRGANSGVKSTPEKTLARMAKKGDMPRNVMLGGTLAGYNEAFELINRYYAMPSSEYLSSQGVNMEKTYRARRNSDGEYELTKRIAVGNIDGIRTHIHVISAPLGSSREARLGDEKLALYSLLRQAGKLDKKEFLKK